MVILNIVILYKLTPLLQKGYNALYSIYDISRKFNYHCMSSLLKEVYNLPSSTEKLVGLHCTFFGCIILKNDSLRRQKHCRTTSPIVHILMPVIILVQTTRDKENVCVIVS